MLQPGEGGPLGSLCAFVVRGWVGSHLFLGCLAATECILSRSFLSFSAAPFPGPLARESRLCLFSACGCLWVVNSSAPRLEYVRQKENSGISSPSSLGSKVPCWLTFSLLFRFFFGFCLGILVVLRRRNRGEYLYSISPEAEV